MAIAKLPSRQNSIWHLVNALQAAVGGGACKKVTLVAYFDAHGNCVGREELQVVKLYPKDIFARLLEGEGPGSGGEV